MTESHEQDAERRLLVIDDEPDTARMIRGWFRDKPYEVIEAHDGIEGLRLATNLMPDLILLDLRMPGEDGIAVARQLKQNPVTMGIPVVLLTACRDVNAKVDAFNVGAEDYVTKPFAFEEIEARIEVMLGRREMFRGLESRVEVLRASNDQLERLVMIDEKTGLYNFREFQRRLREEWQRARRYETSLSLVLLDLDHFKQVNDSLGHQAGDRVLREFATLVTGGARANDAAARYGGEEFAVILPHTDAPMAHRVAERIRRAVREFVFLEDETPQRVTVSAGVATYPSGTRIDSVDELIRAADAALYRAKDAGRDCVRADGVAAEDEPKTAD